MKRESAEKRCKRGEGFLPSSLLCPLLCMPPPSRIMFGFDESSKTRRCE